MDGEVRPRRGEPERAVCLAHRGPAGTVPGGMPSRSGWQREWGGGCQPDTEGPCELRSRVDLVQACEGKPLESCEYGRDTFQMSSLQQEASGRHSSEILDHMVLRDGRRHEAAEPAFLTPLDVSEGFPQFGRGSLCPAGHPVLLFHLGSSSEGLNGKARFFSYP